MGWGNLFQHSNAHSKGYLQSQHFCKIHMIQYISVRIYRKALKLCTMSKLSHVLDHWFLYNVKRPLRWISLSRK